MKKSPIRIISLLLTFLAIVFATVSCDKTAENTNKPVIISGFKFTANGESIIPVGTLQIKPGDVLTIQVVYADPDAGSDLNPTEYTFTWAVERIGGGMSIFNPNENFITNQENPCIWNAPSVTGFYRFIIEIRDRYGTPAQQTVVVEVNANKQPVISELQVSNTSPFVNEEVAITVTATDPDGNLPLEFTWQADGGFFTLESDREAKWKSPVSGSFKITLTINDQAGGNISRTLPINVQANHAPVIQGWDINPGNAVAFGALVTITLAVDDEDNDVLEFNWSADKGTFNSVNKSVAIWRAPNETASCTITCNVRDNKGGSDSAEIIINVS